MDFNWQSPLLKRILILAVTAIALGYFTFGQFDFIPFVILLGAVALQIKLFVEWLGPLQMPAGDPPLAHVHFDELSNSFKATRQDPTSLHFQQALNDALQHIRNNRPERDSEFLFYRNIVMHVAIGLIVFKQDGTIEIFNGAARRLLRINRPEKIDDLASASASLVDIFKKLKTGGRELVRLKLHDDIYQLSVYAIELTLKGEHVKLISIQNIQSELEENEMEAWQNLVRVLTHEIMNSVTPISSLAGVIEEELRQHLSSDASLSREEMDDIHLSLQTISKRSEGLIHFVKEFRSLTNVAKPRPATIKVASLLEEICMLHKRELGDSNINISISVYPEDLTILADKSMIEQVLINLLKNAIQAFDEQEDRFIYLRAYVSEKSRPVISVRDNGNGIDPEALDKIFIPFFTTKQSGSGIGLSLSRQIMRQHQGTLNVKSTPGQGTEFFLRF